jgi:3-deoxy-D-manno-octulosonate 8-phosphate phosphatase (KDO 8-P phosphatase)
MFQEIKLIVSEVDGVVTKHFVPIDELGNVPFKVYYMKDFEAINVIKKMGYKFVFVSSDNKINFNLFRRKNIPFFWAEQGKKEAFLAAVRRYNISLENTMYIGSSYSDIELFKMAQLSICPANAVYDILALSDVVLKAKGGTGALCEVYDLLRSNQTR